MALSIWRSFYKILAMWKYRFYLMVRVTLSIWAIATVHCSAANKKISKKDLDAAKAVGFKTAFVRRPDEWGAEGPPDPEPNPIHDIVVDTFPELAEALGA